MMRDKKNVPKLRFPEFTDDWEQCKFGDLYEKVSEKNDLSFGSDKIISVANMYYKTDVKESDDDYMKTYNVMRLGDIAFEGNKSKNFAHGRFVENTIGDGIVSHVFDVFRPISKYDLLFWKYLINNENVMGKVKARCTKSSTMMTTLVANDFLKESITIPTIEEQRKIGEFLDSLDNLITLQQRKLDQIKEYKKGMLQKMFPKSDETVPELRFPGFGGEWERCTVGDFYEFKNGLNKGKDFFGKGTPIVNFTDVFHNRGIFPEELKGKVQLESSEIKNYEVKKGDIFFTRTSETIEEIGYPSVMLGTPENTVFSGFVLRGRCIFTEDPLDDYFKKYVFFTDTFRTEMLKKSSMTTRALTSGTAIKNMEFRFPKSKGEQQAIGLLLTNLDTLITLHQRKLEAMKEYKKGLLQQMFV